LLKAVIQYLHSLQLSDPNYTQKHPKRCAFLKRDFDHATPILSLHERYRKHLRTTNSVERLNEEIRRRERVIRTFPNRQSVEGEL
jgi:transposase-like protein